MKLVPLPAAYRWIDKEPSPRMLVEMRKVYGTKEVKGPGSNPSIVAWAKSLGFQNFQDATPWCGLGMAYVALQAGYEPPINPLWAANWLTWGTPVPLKGAMLGDVLVFHRKGGNHVSLYVGEDDKAMHIMGANQADSVNIERKSKNLLIGVRRSPWRLNQPANVRKVHLAIVGALAENDA